MPVADHLLRGVVGPAGVPAPQQNALDERLFGHVHVDHPIYRQTVTGEDFVERLGLSLGAGKPVEDIAAPLAVALHVVGDDPHDEFVGCELSRFDVMFHAATHLGAPGDLVADDLAG